MDAQDFLFDLKESWVSTERMALPLEERRFYEYLQFDQSAHFPKAGDSYVRIEPSEIQGLPSPEEFFNGTEPNWTDIKHQVPPKREQYWNVLDSLLDELSDPSAPSSAYLVTGAAGTGKTTLLRSLAFDLANEFSTNCQLFVHIPSTPLEIAPILASTTTGLTQRPIVLIRHAGEYVTEIERLIAESKRSQIPITLLLEERKNQWDAATNFARVSLRAVEFELGSLTSIEIENILDALTLHNCLGQLTDTPRHYQMQHFESLAHKELLVVCHASIAG